MKRMNLKINGELSASTQGADGNQIECDVNVTAADVGAATLELFSTMLNDMAANDVVEVHIEQNNGNEMCHIVTNFGSVNVGNPDDYPAFDLIDGWIVEFQPEPMPEYIDPYVGITQ